MANRFLSNIRINDAYTFPASDGNNGQFIATDGAGNLTFTDPSASSSASIIYRDNFTGDGTTTVFTLQNSLSDEDQTQIYIDGVYQEKSTYSLSTNAITFSTAPINGHSIEVISISGINVGPTTIYQDNFTGDGTTTDFTLAQAIDNEVKTMIYFNGVYQFKDTYTLNSTTISFDTAPANGVDIEVISIASAAAADYNQLVKFYGKATEAISKGDAVMLDGQEGDHFLLSKATQAAISSNHEYFLGLASQDLTTGEFGYVTEFGKINELDTSGYTAGDILWFDAGGSTAGALTTTEPAAPLVKIQVAAVIRSHQNEGVLFVRPTWYHELGELHDVNITSVADKDLLVWNNSNSYWENTKTLGDLTLTGNLTVNGTQTILNTQTVEVEDNILQLNTTQGSPDTATATTSGISVYRGDGVTQASFIFDDGDDTWDLTNNLVVAGNSTFEGNVTTESIFQVYSTGATAVIGAIGNTANDINIYSTSAGHNGLRMHINGILPTDNSGTIIDNDADLGDPNYRFKTLYLGGNANLGASNYLRFTAAASGSDASVLFGNTSGTGGSLTFKRNSDASTILRLDADGNVGIGETSPTQPLHILGAGNYDPTSPGGQTTNGILIKGGWDAGDNNYSAGIGFALGTGTSGISGLQTGGGDADRMGLAFFTHGSGTGGAASSEAMRIEANGNVGIGTTSPTRKLHIVNTDDTRGILVENTLSTSYAEVHVKASREFRIGTGNSSSATDARDRFYVYDATASTHRFTIDSTGKVGIGTTNPKFTLQTNLDITGNLLLYVNGTGNGFSSLNYAAVHNSSAIGTNSTSGLLLANNDKSVGASSPPIFFSAKSSSNLFNAAYASIYGVRTGNGTDTNWCKGDLVFATANLHATTERMRITSVGVLLKGITSAAGVGPSSLADANSTEIGNGYINLARDDTADAKQIVFGKNGARHSFIETTGNGLTFHYGTTGVANLRDNGDGGIWSSETTGRSIGMCSGTNYASGANYAFVKFEGGASSNVVIVANQNGVQLTRNASSWTSNSDERLKENITVIDNVLNKIQNYRCVEYNFINDEIEDKKIGFIAQDWQEDFPQIVEQMENGKIGMKYTETIPVLLKAIQELKADNDNLRERIQTLENQ